MKKNKNCLYITNNRDQFDSYDSLSNDQTQAIVYCPRNTKRQCNMIAVTSTSKTSSFPPPPPPQAIQ